MISIGKEVESDFHNPLGLLSDCHRRIERFLNCLVVITKETKGNKLNDVQREEFEAALRYFREAACKHTLDEEESLFPRLRTCQSDETHAVFALLDQLHSQEECWRLLNWKRSDKRWRPDVILT